MWILSLILSPLSDWLINNKYISRTAGRKIFNSTAHWIPMISLIALGYVTKENANIAVFLLTISVGCNAGTYIGYLINHLDLAPNFAGTLMGITNGIANIFSILGPIAVGFIVTDQKDPYLWKIVFFIAAGFYLIGNLIFVIFGDATIQSWNEPLKNELPEYGDITKNDTLKPTNASSDLLPNEIENIELSKKY